MDVARRQLTYPLPLNNPKFSKGTSLRLIDHAFHYQGGLSLKLRSSISALLPLNPKLASSRSLPFPLGTSMRIAHAPLLKRSPFYSVHVDFLFNPLLPWLSPFVDIGKKIYKMLLSWVYVAFVRSWKLRKRILMPSSFQNFKVGNWIDNRLAKC